MTIHTGAANPATTGEHRIETIGGPTSMTQDAIGRLRARLEYPSDGRLQTVTSIETIVRKDDLRNLLTALDGDGVALMPREPTEAMLAEGRKFSCCGNSKACAYDGWQAMYDVALNAIGGG